MNNKNFIYVRGTVKRVWPVKPCKNGSYMWGCQLQLTTQEEIGIQYFVDNPEHLPSVEQGKQYEVIGLESAFNGKKKLVIKSESAIIPLDPSQAAPEALQGNDEAIYGGCMAPAAIAPQSAPQSSKMDRATTLGLTEDEFHLLSRAKTWSKHRNETDSHLFLAITDLAYTMKDNQRPNPIFLQAVVEAAKQYLSSFDSSTAPIDIKANDSTI